MPRDAVVAVIDTVLAERSASRRPSPELVWTGPEDARSRARDTAVVLRELFASARRRVILAGHSFLNAEQVLGPLHDTMRRHGVEAHFFVDIEQSRSSGGDPDREGSAKLAELLTRIWPFGEPYPVLYADRRALIPGPPWSSLHAKCVSIDGLRALVSSANFTSRGQERNIETGVLLSDAAFAEQLERQWMGLTSPALTVRHRRAGQPRES